MEDVLDAPKTYIANSLPFARETVRFSEWVIIAFLIYAAAAALFLPVAPTVRIMALLVNFAMITSYALLVSRHLGRWSCVIGYIRDWLPLGLILLAYREMGWFALPHFSHTLEGRWMGWDRVILHGGLSAAIEAFGPALPSVLEIAYALVYALAPFCLAILYLYRRRDRVDRLLLVFALGVLLCYAQFPLWPSDPPRVLFAGENLPAYDTLFRKFNWWMLGNYGIHTSCFPSGHVTAAFAAAFGMRSALPERRWVSRFLLIMAFLIAAATVYGRYHYAADAAAGLAVAVFALAIPTVLQNIWKWTGAIKQAASASASADMSSANHANFDAAVRASRSFSSSSIRSAVGAEPALSIGVMQPMKQAGKR